MRVRVRVRVRNFVDKEGEILMLGCCFKYTFDELTFERGLFVG